MPKIPDDVLNNSGTGEPAPAEVRAMGGCWPAYLLPRFARSMGISGLPETIDGMRRHEYLVKHGYELAWQRRKFESVRQVKTTMLAWQLLAATKVLLGVFVYTSLIVGAVQWYAAHWPR